MSQNDELPILHARDECGTYRFIEDVPNGDAYGCFCPACGQPMCGRNAGVKRRHSFTHQPGATCMWGVEAVVTALSKKAIEDTGMIVLPSLSYRNAVSNEVLLETEEMQMKVVKVEENVAMMSTSHRPFLLNSTIWSTSLRDSFNFAGMSATSSTLHARRLS